MRPTVLEALKTSPRKHARNILREIASRQDGYVLAVDFDGTLCDDIYPNIGYPRYERIKRLIRAREMGINLILWTCREGDELDKAVQWCKGQGLEFDAINDNIPERKVLYGNNPRKVGYDELWDDRAVPV